MRRYHIQGGEKEYGIMPADIFLQGESYGRPERLFFLNTPLFSRFERALRLNTEPQIRDTWLQNMGRLYIDTGDHPEYSTPECATARDLVIWQKAGDQIMADALSAMNGKVWEAIFGESREICGNLASVLGKYAAKHGLARGAELIRVYRNSIDIQNRQMFGDHENHLYSAQANPEVVAQAVLLHCISRIIWQGSGLVSLASLKGKLCYTLSQREYHTGNLIQTGTTQMPKPMVNKRGGNWGHEPHADEAKWRRLHLVGGDANMAEVATRLKYGTVMMLIFMAEEGFFDNKPLEYNQERLSKAYKHYSRDLTFRAKHFLMDGNYSALEVQRILLGWAQDFFGNRRYGFLDREIAWQLEWWEKLLDLAAGEDPMKALSPYVDHAAKYCLIRRDMLRHRYAWENDPNRKLLLPGKGAKIISMSVLGRLKYWDLEYHRISNQFSIFPKLPMERVCTDGEIAYAMKFPPPNTRACARRAYADMLEGQFPSSRVSTIEWTFIKGVGFGNKDVGREFLDPFNSRVKLNP